jgi:CelD/BcsL family acetyltransferase involved in cellulose biosynthesis
MTPTWSVLSDVAALGRLRPAWAELLERSDSNETTLSPTWLLAWWRVFGGTGGRKLCTVAIFDGARLIGLAPLLLRWHWYRPGIPFRRIEALGSGEDEADEICSEYLTVIAERGAEERVMRTLATAIAKGAFGAWDELLIPWMDGSKAAPELLAAAFKHEGSRTELRVTSHAPFIPLPTTWEAYLNALSSSHRYLVTRSLRDFESWAAGTQRLERAETVEELPRALSLIESLHGERWASAGHDGAFSSSKFRAFHGAVAPELLRAGELDLLWLTAHGAPIAAAYNLVRGGKVRFYQSGRALGLPPKIRPGVVLHSYAVRRAIERGLVEYDFLGGARLYKTQLALASRPLVQLRVTRAPMLEGVRVLAEAGIGRAAALRRAWRERSSPPASSERAP